MALKRSPLIKPKALGPGARLAIVAPASSFDGAGLEAGASELRALGFDPQIDERIFARSGYLAGDTSHRTRLFLDAWNDPRIDGIICARGGFGSVHLLEHLDADVIRRQPKAFIGYSDVTSLLADLGRRSRLVTFHGPMVAGRLAAGQTAYDRTTFLRAIQRAEPLGPVPSDGLTVLRPGEAVGPLSGGNLTQLAASLGTPYTFDPPAGFVLLVEDVNERPYRLDRLWTQLRLAGVIERASAIVFGEMRGCDEPGEGPTARDTIHQLVATFAGPVLFGLRVGHTNDGHPALTLPLGVRTRVTTSPRPGLIVEEAAVVA